MTHLDTMRVSGRPLQGYYHQSYVLRLPANSALGCIGLDHVKVRSPRKGIAEFDRHVLTSEDNLLELLAQHGVPRIPTVLGSREMSVLTYVRGHTLRLTRQRRPNRSVPREHVRQILELVRSLNTVPLQDISALIDPVVRQSWPKDGDSAGFLRGLIQFTATRVRDAHHADYGALYAALGVDPHVLDRLAEESDTLTPRPFSLLHGDLHDENLVVDTDSRLWTIDWELATPGDPVYELATHLHLMRYPKAQEAEIVERWRTAVEDASPGASAGLDEDLPRYLRYKRVQSVYTDLVRQGMALESAPPPARPGRTAHAAEVVHDALRRARPGPLPVPAPTTIASLYEQWLLGGELGSVRPAG
ncbi:phosphotransferase [Streptomyces smaragdinus]|uniref:phosphotransferase n=1 Tax=Streptomyces smaragdinus TaxID=2585196 RepID=UPI001295850F|nr:aminoglycoside phosphotransferase family protein [Streptomyces smaragdinus]